MSRLLFDPVAYQFYYRCRSDEIADARAAGFAWDPVRRRHYTENPIVAAALASRGDSYVRGLLADAFEAASNQELEASGQPSCRTSRTASISLPLNHFAH